MSAPEDVEALLAHRFRWEPRGAVCSAPDCDWFVSRQKVSRPHDQHRAHVAAVLAAYVVEKQREAVLGAADAWTEWEVFLDFDGHNSIRAHGKAPDDWLRTHAATTYPTPKETP